MRVISGGSDLFGGDLLPLLLLLLLLLFWPH